MKSNYQSYDYLKSFDRIDEILDSSDYSYKEADSIPSRDKLTYSNGFYVNCCALFVDIRESSKLPDKYRRPTLAKIYRTYISEVVAIMNGSLWCNEIYIVGDCVAAVFEGQYRNHFDTAFHAGYTIASLIEALNCKLKKRDRDPIRVGIGMSWGRVLMIKAGYSGSGINEVVWMGNAVNEASNLAGFGNKTRYDHQIMVSTVFYNNLNEHNQGLLQHNSQRACYHGDVVNSEMREWYQKNCVE